VMSASRIHRTSPRCTIRSRVRTASWAERRGRKPYEHSINDPNGEWMKQAARNLTDASDGFLRDALYLIHDRDPLFSVEFTMILKSGGVTTVKLPARSPNLNAYAERFVRSIKSECLSKVIPLSEAHLRRTVTEFTDHYHLERNHQGLDNRLIDQSRAGNQKVGRVERRERLGGLLNFYYREAA